MVSRHVIILAGTLASYVLSKTVHDGILGGTTLIISLLVTLRLALYTGERLHPINAWIAIVTLAGYAALVSILPRCYTDRHHSTFCREMDMNGRGYLWLAGLLVAYFVGGVLLSERSSVVSLSADPVGWVLGGVVVCIIIAIGGVMYGMRSIPITSSESQRLSMRGSLADTDTNTVRILPDYNIPHTTIPSHPAQYALLS